MAKASNINLLTLEQLQYEGNSCSSCQNLQGYKPSRRLGTNKKAPLMIIVEPSGRSQEHLIDPFYGESGDLLIKMIDSMKVGWEHIYLCMAHKCFGKGPKDTILETKPYLERQIELVAPKIILIFGGAGLKILLDEESVVKNRGKWLSYKKIPLMVTYPAAYLQVKESAKKEVWEDLKNVVRKLKATSNNHENREIILKCPNCHQKNF